MFVRKALLLAAIAILFTGSGCHRWCNDWCGGYGPRCVPCCPAPCCPTSCQSSPPTPVPAVRSASYNVPNNNCCR